MDRGDFGYAKVQVSGKCGDNKGYRGNRREVMSTWQFKFNDKKRMCEECGKNYKPKAANQKYCDKCRRGRYVNSGSGSGKKRGSSLST